MDEAKKKKVMWWGIAGAVSGLIISVACYFMVAPLAQYFMFTFFGAALGAAQGYISK